MGRIIWKLRTQGLQLTHSTDIRDTWTPQSVAKDVVAAKLGKLPKTAAVGVHGKLVLTGEWLIGNG